MDAMLRLALRKYNRLRQQVDNMLLGDEGDVIEAELRKFVAKRPCWVNGQVAKATETKPQILHLISSGKKIVIRTTKGERTIAQAKDIFTWGIDGDFTNWGLDVPGEAKLETLVEVHEMTEDGDFKAIYGGLDRNLDNLRLTQDQIIAFVGDNKKWLRKEGYGTFFLFTKKDEPINADKSNLFVADVNLDSDERPNAFVRHFSDDNEWCGGNRHRVVVPQQTLVV